MNADYLGLLSSIQIERKIQRSFCTQMRLSCNISLLPILGLFGGDIIYGFEPHLVSKQ